MPVLAIGGVELVALIVAFAALLVLLAFWVFAKPIEGVLSNVPVIGGYMSNAFSAGLKAVMTGIFSAIEWMAKGTAHMFWAFGTGVWHLWFQTVQTVVDAKQWAIQAYNIAAGAVHTAISTATALAQQAIADAQGLFRTVENDLAAEVTQVETTLQGEINALASGAAAAAIAAEGQALSVITGTLGVLQTEVDHVESEAVTLFGQAETAIAGAVSELEAAIAAGLAGVQADVQGLAGQIQGVEGELAPLLGALPLLGTIPAIGSAVGAITTEVDTCLKPLCDTVTPNAGQLGKLGQFLQGLETLGVDVLVAGLFLEAVTNPAGLARETVTLAEDVGGPVITGIRDLTGL